MIVCEKRNIPHKAMFFIHWQLWPIVLSLPGHLAFIARGWDKSRCGIWSRIVLTAKLIKIHLFVPCVHTPLELLYIIEEIIELPSTIPGVIVECGAYQGGSTAKLSLAAALSKRSLVVCDSFEGLPEVGAEDQVDSKENFQKGDFLACVEHVRTNIQLYGNIKFVEFAPGWYQESLEKLDGTNIVCLFLDVDRQESIQTCLTALWKLIQPGCKVFVHDVDRPAVVRPFRDRVWWSREIGSSLPKFVGDGNGLGWQRRLLGYAIKP
jgi:O-methyltransferase